MKLSAAMERYVLHWGEMGARWGVNRSVSQIHALLYLVHRPMTAEEIAETLSIARSNVSTSLKELQNWNLVQIVTVLGDRRDHFEARSDNWEILMIITEQRKRREIDPTIEMLRQFAADAANDSETPADVKERMAALLGFMETLTNWYEDVRRLPRNILVKLLKLGAKVSRFVLK
jgi:DNA-binding transcriptional regulator GbsR (MarR family)